MKWLINSKGCTLKILMFGNYQIDFLANYISLCFPEWKITTITLRNIQANGPESFMSEIDSADYIVAHPMERADIGAFRQSNLVKLDKTIFIPAFTFSGFHPDCVYIHRDCVYINDKGIKTSVKSGVGDYHSAIAIYGYHLGLNVDQTLKLFNSRVYEILGYYSLYEVEFHRIHQEFLEYGFDISNIIAQWRLLGCFMYTVNHPKSQILSDIAELIIDKLQYEIPNFDLCDAVPYTAPSSIIWPVYPSIANFIKCNSSNFIKVANSDYTKFNKAYIDDKEFVNLSFKSYKEYKKELNTVPYINSFEENVTSIKEYLLESSNVENVSKHSDLPHENFNSPYTRLPESSFWKSSIAAIPVALVDPVTKPNFTISTSTKVATAGSCFAEHIANNLKANGFNYLVTEKEPANLTPLERLDRNYSIFTARYANLYTAKQLLQLLQEAVGLRVPMDSHWKKNNGKYIDPFRPEIEKLGFDNTYQLALSRKVHLAAVRDMIKETEVFVFTLGATEAWRHKIDQSVVPLHPAAVSSTTSSNMYEFHNFNVSEVKNDLKEVIDLILSINPSIKFILTVSPIPLIATFSDKHSVLTNTTYSKSVLRVAADEVAQKFACVEYFPSYEIITGNYNRGAYYDIDLRSIRPEGVKHVMNLFFKHYCHFDMNQNTHINKANSNTNEKKILSDIICEEELIQKSNE